MIDYVGAFALNLTTFLFTLISAALSPNPLVYYVGTGVAVGFVVALAIRSWFLP